MRELASNESVLEHPVTDVALYNSDRPLLAYMLQDLKALVRQQVARRDTLVSYDVRQWQVNGLRRRTVLCRPERLSLRRDVRIVGFLGEPRDATSEQMVNEVHDVDGVLIAELVNCPGILAYSSMELVDNYWANLVVHESRGDTEKWRGLAAHVKAASQMSPRYFRSVRIHTGVLRDGVAWNQGISLEATKYWDYGEDDTGQVWQAYRSIAMR